MPTEVINIHPIKESFEIKDIDKVEREKEKNKRKDDILPYPKG